MMVELARGGPRAIPPEATAVEGMIGSLNGCDDHKKGPWRSDSDCLAALVGSGSSFFVNLAGSMGRGSVCVLGLY